MSTHELIEKEPKSLIENKILLVVGESGSGKSTLVDRLVHKYKWVTLDSYTTRPKRYKDEQGHIFVNPVIGQKCMDDKEYLKHVSAYTFYNGHHYWATNQQIDSSDVYVVDRDGVIDLQNKYKGDKRLIVVRVKAPIYKRIYRMLKRGDNIVQVAKRIVVDFKKFRGVDKISQIVIDDLSINDGIKELERMLWFY